MTNRSEYWDEYCGGMKTRRGGKGGHGGEGSLITPCRKSYEVQPVGGRSQAKHYEEAKRAYFASTRAPSQPPASAAQSCGGSASQQLQYQPGHDEAFSTTVYSDHQRTGGRGRWQPPTTAGFSTTDSPRDVVNRHNFWLHEVTLANKPAQPMAEPDVHKLRYMQNNYMTGDDWY